MIRKFIIQIIVNIVFVGVVLYISKENYRDYININTILLFVGFTIISIFVSEFLRRIINKYFLQKMDKD